ncbi:MAG: hypothetical protein MH208_17155 [Marinobacter sp.]|nr:hypothetical protein [Marinobacter sp.]
MSSRKDRSADDIRRSTERLQRARKQPGTSPLRGIGAFWHDWLVSSGTRRCGGVSGVMAEQGSAAEFFLALSR